MIIVDGYQWAYTVFPVRGKRSGIKKARYSDYFEGVKIKSDY